MAGTRDPGLSGITTLMNSQHIDPTTNTNKVEGKFFNAETSTVAGTEIDHDKDEISKLARELNINMDGDLGGGGGEDGGRKPFAAALDNLSSDRGTPRGSKWNDDRKSQSYGAGSQAPRQSVRSRKAASNYAPVIPPPPSPSERSVISMPQAFNRSRSEAAAPRGGYGGQDGEPVRMIYNRKTTALTEEHAKKEHIDKVLHNIRGEGKNTFSTQYEQTMDSKANKIEQIANLKMGLLEEGVETTDYPTPNIHSPIEEINTTLTLLTIKYNKYRYSTLAEEAISGLAEGLETIFDGTTTIPILNIAPDYTGYSSTVNVKLHRLRHETSQVVAGFIEKHNFTPMSRILMECAPGFFLYPASKSKQKAKKPPTHLSTASSQGAFNKMRSKIDTNINDL